MDDYPRGDQRSVGTGLQSFSPKPIVLARMGGLGAGQKKIPFVIPTPDSRLRIRLDVVFVPAAGVVIPAATFTNAFGIWLFGSVNDQTGQSGLRIPVANVEGTEALFSTFPAADALLGYSREFTTASDYVEGQANVGALSPNAIYTGATWVLQTRYQPDSVRFTPDEWNEVTQRCTPFLNDSVFTVA